MRRFRNILVVHDDSIGADDVLTQASALARANEANLTIAAALPVGRQSTSIKTETEKRLQRLVDSLRLEGVKKVDCIVLEGVPFAAIFDQVVLAKHDIVIIGRGDDWALRSMLFGSTAAQLVRKCPCPVWVLPPGQSVPYEKIMVAVDATAEPDGGTLDRKIMDLATSLACRDSAVLHVVHAWEVDGKDADTIRSEVKTEELRKILKLHEARHRSGVDELLAHYPIADIDHRLHFPRAPRDRAIRQLVEREGIDLIVMGTVARAGFAGFLIGNAVERILESVNCGVLVVKPDDFKAPMLVTLPRESPRRREDLQAVSSRGVG